MACRFCVLNYGNTTIFYELNCSRRRSPEIAIYPDRTVVVKVPEGIVRELLTHALRGASAGLNGKFGILISLISARQKECMSVVKATFTWGDIID